MGEHKPFSLVLFSVKCNRDFLLFQEATATEDTYLRFCFFGGGLYSLIGQLKGILNVISAQSWHFMVGRS